MKKYLLILFIIGFIACHTSKENMVQDYKVNIQDGKHHLTAIGKPYVLTFKDGDTMHKYYRPIVKRNKINKATD